MSNKKNEILIKKLRIQGITDKTILNVMKKIPREIFVEKIFLQQAYENIALPIQCKQTISQPYVIAYMISCLNLKKNDEVLEIGTGSGYQTAILSHLCKHVYTIERINKLLVQAKKNIGKLNIKNITYKLGNGMTECLKKKIFDGIVVSAASSTIPKKLLKKLKKGKCLIMPKQYLFGDQKLIIIKKIKENQFSQKKLIDVRFVPLLDKIAE